MKSGANHLMGSRLSVITMVALSVSLVVPTTDISPASSDTPSSHTAVPAEVAASSDTSSSHTAVPAEVAASSDTSSSHTAVPTEVRASAAPESAITVGQRKFTDVGGGVHAPAIIALHDLGVFNGTECNSSSFCPDDPLKRWVMAVWLVRILDNETQPPSMKESQFKDVFEDVEATSWWAPFVERLAELGITVGCEAGKPRFCPDETVTRMQMATFLVRAFKLPAAASMGFTDVSVGVHKPAVDTLAALKIAAGCNTQPLRYCSGNAITRKQMATFLARTLGLVDLPSETLPVYASVSAGDSHSCGVRTDGTVTCWGVNDKGQVDAPAQVFSSVSAGSAHTCGVQIVTPGKSTADEDTDTTPISGPIKCWGANTDKQTEAPQGEFWSVSAGSAHTCGVQIVTPEEGTADEDTDTTPISGPIKCWGANNKGQAKAPEGIFTAVSSGHSHSCGVQVITPEERTTDEDTGHHTHLRPCKMLGRQQ